MICPCSAMAAPDFPPPDDRPRCAARCRRLRGSRGCPPASATLLRPPSHSRPGSGARLPPRSSPQTGSPSRASSRPTACARLSPGASPLDLAVQHAPRRRPDRRPPGPRRAPVRSRDREPGPGSPASAERLLATRELAREALREEPASWRRRCSLAPPSVSSAAARDPRGSHSLAKDWERPLVVAGEFAPPELQPRRLLAAAYLEVWPALTAEKRAKVELLLREAFLEPQTFERLFAPWVEIAGSSSSARRRSCRPGRSTYQRLAATAFARQAGATMRCGSRRHRRSLRETFAERPGGGARGRRRAARRRRPLWPAAGAAALRRPPRRRSRGRRVRAVRRDGARRPPARPRAGVAGPRRRCPRLGWAQPLCLVRDCPFSPPAMARLASLAGSTLAGSAAAFAALAAGDLPRAELLERRSEELWSEPWAPFLTLKAKQQAARKEPCRRARRSSPCTAPSAPGSPGGRLAERLGAVGVLPGPPLARDSWEEPPTGGSTRAPRASTSCRREPPPPSGSSSPSPRGAARSSSPCGTVARCRRSPSRRERGRRACRSSSAWVPGWRWRPPQPPTSSKSACAPATSRFPPSFPAARVRLD